MEITWGGGQGKILEAQCEAKLEFLDGGGGGCKTKTFCGGGGSVGLETWGSEACCLRKVHDNAETLNHRPSKVAIENPNKARCSIKPLHCCASTNLILVLCSSRKKSTPNS